LSQPETKLATPDLLVGQRIPLSWNEWKKPRVYISRRV